MTETMFSPQTYSDRRKKLIQRLAGQSGLLVFMGNELCPMNYTDNTFPFRQDSSFLYCFGLDSPSLAAVIDLDSAEETLYGNDLTVEEIVWMGHLPGIREMAQWCEVANTGSREQFFERIRDARRQGRSIHLLPQYQPQNKLLLSELLNVPPSALNGLISEPFTRAVIAMRSVKSPEEVEQIEQAVRVTRAMHEQAMRVTKPGLTESQVAAELERVVLSNHCRMAFPLIFTSRGEILHNHFTARVLNAGDLVIHDSGAQTPMGYAGDITRTIPVGGRFTPRQKAVYQLVRHALARSIEKVAPGVEFKSIHLHACRLLAEGLKDLGLMKGDPAQAVEQGAHALFFPCGLGHMMGLDVHDMEGLNENWVGYTETLRRSEQFGLRSLRLAKALEPGFVVTVEPGVYFIPPLIDQWQQQNRFTDFICYNEVRKYLDFGGVRIEDDVLVTPEGYRILSADILKTCDQVEAMAAENNI